MPDGKAWEELLRVLILSWGLGISRGFRDEWQLLGAA
jgi:hypothetical protein